MISKIIIVLVIFFYLKWMGSIDYWYQLYKQKAFFLPPRIVNNISTLENLKGRKIYEAIAGGVLDPTLVEKLLNEPQASIAGEGLEDLSERYGLSQELIIKLIDDKEIFETIKSESESEIRDWVKQDPDRRGRSIGVYVSGGRVKEEKSLKSQ